ncbi:cytochrome c3 family protein [Thermosulfurimonas sp. F29]|uniref:cytochrome c3 family protein n=1 Tax=Thermosulfurimonas sp. F29 TaxID=2867247 RepID=UPI001C832690|nr:cytochrome c3 family protein [Thermosulfurimonas sp. F29]MBX6422051.1 cytochrome c3 family protein [Thermosulfurimonas sp. F29]
MALLWAGVFMVILGISFGESVYAGRYLRSAHGNSTAGVLRNWPAGGPAVSTGNCFNCHEMHASVGGSEPQPPSPNGGPSPYTLFSPAFISQTQGFCLDCHDGSTTVSSRSICNYSYSYRAGGWTADSLNNIRDMFDTSSAVILSAHNLSDILDFITTNSTWGFTRDTSPCVACHNPHYVQGDPFDSSGPKSSGSRGWMLTRPSAHGSSNPRDFLWGDDSGERMKDYAGAYIYQAPYRYGSTSQYEPDGSTTTDGSNLADMVTFCLDCHSSDMSRYGLNNTPIDWSLNGDKHGLRPADNGTDLRPPYDNSKGGSYVLACTDCHEPHGARNLYLIRQEVNGDVLGTNIRFWSSNQWGYLCARCHKDDAAAFNGTQYSWKWVHHCSDDAPYTGSAWGKACTSSSNAPPKMCGPCHANGVRNCTNCHAHGKDDSWILDYNPSYYTGRRCF